MGDNKPTIILSGLPGKMATLMAETLLNRGSEYSVSFLGLTGDNQPKQIRLSEETFLLGSPLEHDEILGRLKDKEKYFVIVDFSQPDAVNRNSELYCRHQIPFVMGTTGGDRKKLEQVVVDSGNIAVIAPNMAYPVVLMQAMLEWAAKEFPNVLEGFDLKILESHQQGKKDTSGTAKAMVSYFNKLGIPFNPEEIVMARNPEVQKNIGIPEEYLSGHGWHTYSLWSSGSDVKLQFQHNVNGRQPYVQGALKALDFLAGKISAGEKGKVYSMIDVMRGK